MGIKSRCRIKAWTEPSTIRLRKSDNQCARCIVKQDFAIESWNLAKILLGIRVEARISEAGTGFHPTPARSRNLNTQSARKIVRHFSRHDCVFAASNIWNEKYWN